ncbi:MAG: hypothetical protein ACRDIY_13365 [Chloroflexota bacterium]
MNWKVFALLESSFCVLLSVVAVIFLFFVMSERGGSGFAEPIAIAGIVLSIALTLVAHGQLIGSFRRQPPGVEIEPRAGSLAIPILTIVAFGDAALLSATAGAASWAEFARVYVTYFLAPPAALALVSRLFVMWLTRGPSRAPGS